MLRALSLPESLGNAVLLEAETFSDSGGWLVDAQHMDQMGSSYLLAHGLGVPCADAVTTVKVLAAGGYRIWIRTRDWAAPHQPGKFQVLIDGNALGPIFGTNGGQWAWQDGGVVELGADGDTRIALHDLTGFDARCDAILLVPVSWENFSPPNKPTELEVFRRHLLGIPQAAENGASSI